MLRLALLLTCLSTPVQAMDLYLYFHCASPEAVRQFIEGDVTRSCRTLFGVETMDRKATLVDIIDIIEVDGREVHIGKLELNGRIVYSAGALEQELIG